MSGTWSVQERTHTHREYRTCIDRLSRAIAIATADVLHTIHPTYQFRIVNEATGELVHMGLDGKPVTA